MFKYKVGFIGAGNMGGAIAACLSQAFGEDKIAVACSSEESTSRAAKKLSCVAEAPSEIISRSEYVFLGIKPQMLSQVVEPLKNQIKNSKATIVSMLAGVTTQRLENICGTNRIIRIMPNVACEVGEGMTLVCASAAITAQELDAFCEMMMPCGVTDILCEKLFDAGSALSGCGPAFASIFIEAIADGAVKCGLPRDKAYLYAQQTLIGTSKLMLQTKKHPALLKDSVCSPGGSTIAGVEALEKGAFRGAAIDAVAASFSATKKLGEG